MGNEGTEYEFRVMCENVAGIGEPSAVSKPVLIADPKFPPAPPAMPKLRDVTRNSLDISWSRPSYDGGMKLEQYVIYIADELAPEQWIRITATNKIGESDPAQIEGECIPKEVVEEPSFEV